METLMEYLAKGFMVMLSISLPCVLMAATVGLVVGILQAVTSVQEQTIAAAPKIVLVFLTIVVLGGYYITILKNYIFEGINIAFQVVPKNEIYVLPNNYYKYTKPFSAEMNDTIIKTNGSIRTQGNIPWDKKALKHQIYVKSKQTEANDANLFEKMQINKNK